MLLLLTGNLEWPLGAPRSHQVAWIFLWFERKTGGQTPGHNDITHLTQTRSQGGCKWAQCTPKKSGRAYQKFTKYQRQTLIITLTHVRHPALSTFCVCWTAVVEDNLFSKMYVHAGRFVLCYRVHYVIKWLIYGPDRSAYYAYAYTV